MGSSVVTVILFVPVRLSGVLVRAGLLGCIGPLGSGVGVTCWRRSSWQMVRQLSGGLAIIGRCSRVVFAPGRLGLQSWWWESYVGCHTVYLGRDTGWGGAVL